MGDHVAYSAARTGSYADFVVVDVEKAVHVPDGLSPDTIAASFIKGSFVGFDLLLGLKQE